MSELSSVVSELSSVSNTVVEVVKAIVEPVSYTHLTLPTNREV